MSPEDQQAADLLGYGTRDEQVQAVASALCGARLEAEARTWRRAVEALRTEGTRLLADGKRMTEVAHFDRAANFLESLSGQTPASVLPTPPTAGSSETGKTDG